MENKFSLRREGGNFSKKPEEYSIYHKIGKDRNQTIRKVFEQSEHMDFPLTEKRRLRLLEISKRISLSLKRYRAQGRPYDPRLINWDTALYVGGEPWGSLNLERGSKKAHITLMPNYLREKPYSGQINDKTLDKVFAHELIHLYSARTWQDKQDTSEESLKERLTRVGLHFNKDGDDFWLWVNEAITEDLAQEEIRAIKKDTYPESYEYYRELFSQMVEALSKLRKVSKKEIIETFRQAAIGPNSLLGLRRIINPPFKSLLDFIMLTDGPRNLCSTREEAQKVYGLLFKEIEEGSVETSLQKTILEDQALLSKYRQMIIETYDINERYWGSKLTPELKEKLKIILGSINDLEWVLEIFKLEYHVGEKELRELVDAKEWNWEGDLGPKQLQKILEHLNGYAFILVLLKNHPEVREKIIQNKRAPISPEDIKDLYLNVLTNK